jgi:hypothetical protein
MISGVAHIVNHGRTIHMDESGECVWMGSRLIASLRRPTGRSQS